MSEEDTDLRELIKAIRQGDKERAESIAITLFKNPPNPNKYVKKINNPNPELLLQIIAIGATVIFAILAFLDFWFSHRSKKKEEIQYV